MKFVNRRTGLVALIVGMLVMARLAGEIHLLGLAALSLIIAIFGGYLLHLELKKYFYQKYPQRDDIIENER